jgi:hypothetical protein
MCRPSLAILKSRGYSKNISAGFAGLDQHGCRGSHAPVAIFTRRRGEDGVVRVVLWRKEGQLVGIVIEDMSRRGVRMF